MRALALIAFVALAVASGCDVVVGLDRLTMDRDAAPRDVDPPTTTSAEGVADAAVDATIGDARVATEAAPGSTPDAARHREAGEDAGSRDAAPDAVRDAGDAGDDLCELTGACFCVDKSSCPAGFDCCNGRCADLTRDVANCGTCNLRCTQNRICDQGACSCGGLDPYCAATCVDYFADPENCGECGHSCLGGECMGGTCQPVALATEQPGPAAVAVDRHNVYFANQAGDSVGRVAKQGPACSGSTCVTFSDPSLAAPFGIAADGVNVYVAGWANGGPGGAVLQLPTSLASSMLLATARGPWGIAAANGRVYFTARNDATYVASVPINGGAVTTIAAGPTGGVDVRAIAADGASVVWGARGIATVGAGSLYHAGAQGACGPQGCAPITLATGAPQAFFLDGEWLYWTASDGKVRKMVKSGGCKAIQPCPIVIAENQPDPQFVVADGPDVWWTAGGDGSLRRGSAYRTCRGTRCQAVAAGLGGVSGLAQDTTSLYVTSRSLPGLPEPSGVVWRLAK